jgi:hypothetical protein
MHWRLAAVMPSRAARREDEGERVGEVAHFGVAQGALGLAQPVQRRQPVVR